MRERYGSSSHGIDFLPATGPKADIVAIIEANYEEDGDGRYVNEGATAQEIIDLFVREYGLTLP